MSSIRVRLHAWKISVPFCIALVAVGLLGSSLIARATDGPGSPAAPVSPGVALDPLNRPEVYSRLPPDKRALLDKENALRNAAAAKAAPPGKAPHITVAVPTPLPKSVGLGTEYWPAGAGTLRKLGCEQLFPHAGLTSNSWFEAFPDHQELICAGAALDDPLQGILFVNLRNANGTGQISPQLKQPVFPTPSKHGKVTVVTAVGEVLTVQAQDGTLFYFDVSRLAYVDGPPAEGTRTAKPSP